MTVLPDPVLKPPEHDGTPVALGASDVTWKCDGRDILRGIGLNVAKGELAGLIGPNGSGKSSFLRTVYRVLKPTAGLITLDGDDVWKLSVRHAARRTAAVLQETTTEFEFTVAEIVSMGRTPHKGPLDRETRDDHRIVNEALERVGMVGFVRRNFATLSGGEKQRVLIARALAQQAQFLVLDEPTNHLDIRYQLEILELVRGLGVTALAALHDLNLAAYYCDRIFILDEGKIVATGTPTEVLQPDLLRAVFGVGVLVQTHPLTGRPHLVFFHHGSEIPT
jgi:iron complex transport system ATP-binding protein